MFAHFVFLILGDDSSYQHTSCCTYNVYVSASKLPCMYQFFQIIQYNDQLACRKFAIITQVLHSEMGLAAYTAIIGT